MLRGAAIAVLLASTLMPTAPARAGGAFSGSTRESGSTQQPNILLIVSDDQAWSTFDRSLNPAVYSELVDKGALFTRAYVGTSLCCPSRSEILTGLHEHHTGVDYNFAPLERPTIVEALHDLGYATMLSGKYLNSWPCTPRPEFDRWVCQFGEMGQINPTLHVDGKTKHYTGYASAIEAQFVTSFISQTPSNTPFFVMYTPKVPHLPADDPRYDSMTVEPLRGPSFDQETRNGKLPQYLQRAPLDAKAIADIDRNHMNMAQSVRALDDDISSILASLGSRADNTLVFYLSDNGYLYGDHRRTEKETPYEESVKVPFVVRWPAFLPEANAFATDALVQNVDVAPTIADAVGIHWGADGASLIPILRDPAATVRTGALVQHCEGVAYPCYPATGVPSFKQIVTEQYAYVEYVSDEAELYDLTVDPAELNNLAADPAYAETKATLRSNLADLRAPPEPDTTIAGGPVGTWTKSRVVAFTYFSQSRFAHYRCRLTTNGVPGPWDVCDDQPAVLGPLADGDYIFDVEGTDELGVTDPTPDSRPFSIVTTGPDVQIQSGPPPYQPGSTATFDFSSTQAVSYRCSLTKVGSETRWTPCSAPEITYDGLADGQYFFQVRALDEGGVVAQPGAAWLFRIENDGPTVVLFSKPPASTPDTDAQFEFRAVEAVTEMTCAVDSETPVDCLGGSFEAIGLTEGAHTLHIAATDVLGFTSDTTFHWKVDVTPPTTRVKAKPPKFTAVSEAEFSFSQNEGATFHCVLDGAPAIICSPKTAYYALPEGPHTLVVAAFDRAGNESPGTELGWTQDTIAPTVTITSGPHEESPETRAEFRFKASEDGTNFACSLDGGAATACKPPVFLPGLAEGPHSFSVAATDRVGNAGPASTWDWAVDLTPPSTTVTSGPDDPTSVVSASFEFTSDDAAATFSCSLDEAAPVPCSSPATYGPFQEGSHSFAAWATDAAGNVGAPSRWDWTVDLTAPVASITSGPADPTKEASATFAFTATEPGVTFSCSLDGAQPTPCASSITYDSLSEGDHTFEVSATDPAGNVGPPAAWGWTVDLTAPIAQITSGPEDPTREITATFTFTSDDPSAVFACSLDGSPATACASPVSYDSLPVGRHTFDVTASDPLGNAGPPAEWSWKILGVPSPGAILLGEYRPPLW